MIKFNENDLLVKRFNNGDLKIPDLYDKINFLCVNVLSLYLDTEDKKYLVNNDLMMLYFMKDWLDSFESVEVALDLHVMPYCRMDRKLEGYLFTLESAVKYICIALQTEKTFKYINVCDPHSNQTKKLFQRYIPKNVEYIETYPITSINLKKFLSLNTSNYDKTELEKCVLVFPDMEAYQKYSEILNRNENLKFLMDNFLVFNKKRDLYTEKLCCHEIIKNDTFYKLYEDSKSVYVAFNFIIIDDICDTCKTLISTAKSLKDLFGSNHIIYLFTSHCSSAIHSSKLFCDDTPITKFVTTNTMGLVPLGNEKNIEIFKY